MTQIPRSVAPIGARDYHRSSITQGLTPLPMAFHSFGIWMVRKSTDLTINKISDYVTMVRDAPPPTPTGVVYHRHGCKPVWRSSCAVTEPRRGDTNPTVSPLPYRRFTPASVIWHPFRIGMGRNTNNHHIHICLGPSGLCGTTVDEPQGVALGYICQGLSGQ